MRKMATPFLLLSMLVLALFLHGNGLVQAMNFGIIGDWGMGGRWTNWQSEIRSTMMYNEACAQLKCNFTISVGDNIYVGDVMKGLQESFVNMYDHAATGPFFPSIGNHDQAGPQIQYHQKNKHWRFDSAYYTYKLPIDDTGYTIQLFAVNTEDGGLGGGGQYTWLENELRNSDARWKIIFGHYPTTGSGRHRRVGTVGRIHSLMEQYNAQVYLAGHDHILEVSNVQGRVLGISGAMARGGMMLRGIGGKTRKFTLTNPSEYNKFAQDWPGHGFMTAMLSPNVLTMQMWNCYGGVEYEFSVTYNWMKQLTSLPAAQQGEWPSPEIVLKAYKEESELPIGNATHDYYVEDDILKRTLAPGETLKAMPKLTSAPHHSSSNKKNTSKHGDKHSNHTESKEAKSAATRTAHPSTLPPTNRPHPTQPFVLYAVSTECEGCKNRPTAGQPFSVALEGGDSDDSWLVYLTTVPVGCQLKDHSDLVPGTSVIAPTGNVVTFNSTGKTAIPAVYVCLSQDKGSSFHLLSRADTFYEETKFSILPALQAHVQVTTSGKPRPKQSTRLPGTNLPLSTQGAAVAATQPAAGGSTDSASGHSITTVMVVGSLCLLVGIGGAIFVGKLQQQYQSVASSSAE